MKKLVLVIMVMVLLGAGLVKGYDAYCEHMADQRVDEILEQEDWAGVSIKKERIGKYTITIDDGTKNEEGFRLFKFEELDCLHEILNN